MLRALVVILAEAAALQAQITVSPQRIAGVPPSAWPIGDGGPATDALLTPTALAWDRSGNLLIADSRNQRVRRLASDGTISTVFTQTGSMYSMAVDSKGNLYTSVAAATVTDQPQLLEWAPNGSVTVIQSPGTMQVPPGIAIDAADNLYITDQAAEGGGFVWKLTPQGAAVKVAGYAVVGGIPGSSGPALQVTLGGPHALSFDSSGNLLIADWAGILRLNPDGTLTRFVGDWTWPVKIAGAPDGSVYFTSDYYGIQRWTAAGGVVQFAGTQQQDFSDGCALSGGQRVAKYASMDPADLLVDPVGRLFFADDFIDPYDPTSIYSFSAGRVRRIDPDGSIRTVAGSGNMPPETPPGGPASQAIFHNPEVLAVDSDGNVFFAESSANRVQEITAAGQYLTVAGTDSAPAGEDPACYPSTGDVLSSPKGVAVDAAGNLYISDTGNNRILLRSPEGVLTTIAGTGTAGNTGDGGLATAAEISGPTSIAVTPDGSIYFVAAYTLRRIESNGILDTPAAPQFVGFVAAGLDGNLILDGQYLYKETPGGVFYGLRAAGGVMATDPNGAVYFPGGYGMTRVSANCNVADVAFASATPIPLPQGLANDSQGNLFATADDSVWRIAAIAPPAIDAPAVALDDPGVFNAASNLTVTVNVQQGWPSEGYSYEENDAITGNEIVRLTGGCLGPLAPVEGSFSGGGLPTTLAGTQVLFNGVAAPLVSVQALEILAIAPQAVASQGQATVTVENQGVAASAELSAATAVPGIFVNAGTQAAAINQDGTVNGPDHPAPVGSIISLFLTGAGVTNPPALDGVPPSQPLPPLALPVTVQVEGLPAQVLYAGAAAGLPGVAQINVQIPAGAAGSGAAAIQVAVGGYSRDQAVTIAVQ